MSDDPIFPLCETCGRRMEHRVAVNPQGRRVVWKCPWCEGLRQAEPIGVERSQKRAQK